jgi:hypothetical protein
VTQDQIAKLRALRLADLAGSGYTKWSLRYLLETPDGVALSPRKAQLLDSLSYGGRHQVVHEPPAGG